jgi:hypothetical protein
MNLTIREADLERDKPILVGLFRRYLFPFYDERRFEWLYRNNPHGQARTWIAVDADRGEAVGAASAFPRRVCAYDQEETGWVLGDFCLADQYRSLGPAVQLQRKFVREVDAGAISFFYDFPSTAMMAVFKRLRIEASDQIVRLTKPIRVDRKVREAVKNPLVARMLSAVGNLLLRTTQLKTRTTYPFAMDLHRGTCGEEFSRLARQVGGDGGAWVQRSAPYLNWRYFASPHVQHELLTVREGSTLLAYAVFTQAGEDATLVDVYGAPDRHAVRAAIVSTMALLGRRGVAAIHAPLLASHPWVGIFELLGFRRRNEAPCVTYASAAFSADGPQGRGLRWCFMHGDRDS